MLVSSTCETILPCSWQGWLLWCSSRVSICHMCSFMWFQTVSNHSSDFIWLCTMLCSLRQLCTVLCHSAWLSLALYNFNKVKKHPQLCRDFWRCLQGLLSVSIGAQYSSGLLDCICKKDLQKILGSIIFQQNPGWMCCNWLEAWHYQILVNEPLTKWWFQQLCSVSWWPHCFHNFLWVLGSPW